MNIKSLLKYQKLDEELFKIEQKLANSQFKKKANELASLAKKSQAKSAELEAQAEKLLAEINDIKSKCDINQSKCQDMLKTDVSKLSSEDIDKLNVLKGKILSNINILEKMLQKSAENINHILAEFNQTKKTFDDARNQYQVCKQKIDEETKTLEPEQEKIRQELLVLEKEVEPNLMAEYKKKRNDHIFPVIVPLENSLFCGRCRMEQPKAALSKLKEKGIITCEHCKRFIFVENE